MGDEVLQEAVHKCREMGLRCSEDEIRNALTQCNGKLEDAMPLLLTDSPQRDSNLLHEYNIIPSRQFHEREDSFERDVDMRDTETHPGSGAESDKDSTTVSYSVENLRDMEGEEGEVVEEGGEIDMSDIPPRPEGPPPRYEDIINDGAEESPSPPEMEDGGGVPEMKDGGGVPEMEDRGGVPEKEIGVTGPQSSSSGVQAVVLSPHTSRVEFPLTHYYELEGRVHTEQWSIPYKREESLGVCMLATIKMIREGEGRGDEWIEVM